MPLEMEQFNVQEQIQRYVRILKDKWFLIVVCAIVAALIGYGAGQLWPKTYESSTLFVLRGSRIIDDFSSLEKSIKDVKLNVKQQTLTREIRSQTRLETTLKKLEWKEYITAQMDPMKKLQNFYTKVRSKLGVLINTDPIGDTQVEISFTWTDPHKAARFCETMRDTWVDAKIDKYKEDCISRCEKAEYLVSERMKAYRKAQRDLEEFEMEHNYAAMGTRLDNYQIRAELTPKISQNRAKVESKGQEIADLENELAKTPKEIDKKEQKKNPEFEKAYSKWMKSRETYERMAKRYTEAHPGLKRAKDSMDEARASVDELQEMGLEYVVVGLSGEVNPDYRMVREKLVDLRPEYAEAKAALAQQEEQLREIEQRIADLPFKENEYKRLEAEIELAMEKYQKAEEEIQPLRDRISSFQTMRKTGSVWQAESTFKNSAYEVLDAAIPATEPKNPMAIIIMVVFILGGLGLGLVLALAGELLKSSFSTMEEVAMALQKPVLGGVNRIMTAAEIRSIRWRKVIFTSSSLLVIFSLVALIYICNAYPQLIPPAIVEQVNSIREALG